MAEASLIMKSLRVSLITSSAMSLRDLARLIFHLSTKTRTLLKISDISPYVGSAAMLLIMSSLGMPAAAITAILVTARCILSSISLRFLIA